MIIITINIINRETPIIELIIIVFFFLFIVVSPNKSEDKSASFDIGLSSSIPFLFFIKYFLKNYLYYIS